VASIHGWWRAEGRRLYPRAGRLSIAALGRQLAEAIDLGFRPLLQLKGKMAGQFEWM
jgi:hypothetical protein